MKSPFDFKNSSNNNVRRTNFDWSKANNLTTAIGRITPAYCELCPANSSLKIDPTLGLQFFPMVFPNQTRMYARMSFFKIPLRTLWEDYMDFVGNFRDGLVEPYIDFKDQTPKTGSLYDYLGLPTTLAGTFGGVVTKQFTSGMVSKLLNLSRFTDNTSLPSDSVILEIANKNLSNVEFGEWLNGGNVTPQPDMEIGDWKYNPSGQAFPAYCVLSTSLSLTGNEGNILTIAPLDSSGGMNYPFSALFIAYDKEGNYLTYAKHEWMSDIKVNIPSGAAKFDVWFVPKDGNYSPSWKLVGLMFNDETTKVSQLFLNGTYSFNQSTSGSVRDLDSTISPYYDSSSDKKDKQIKIAAYSPRAYEAVYNAFFRDIRNNPYYVDGVVEYNKWIPTRAGGADNTTYRLHYCNWEKDVFTTAVQSPQQGVAPLVGITTYADTVKNDDGSTSVLNRVALVDEDGRKFGVDFQSDSEGLTAVQYTELSDAQAVSKPRSLIDLVNSGISINDLRNVNAYQKFLELNMRQGYSYRDIIQGRFNVKVRYDELMMPEYCGGFSEEIKMSAVTQTVQKDLTSGKYADQLGAMAGNAGLRRSGKSISIFCDEECIVLGLLYVVPVPIYTQVLPKHFLYRGLLDHFQPEFANIGFQPITYRELCPIQAFNENPDKLTDTFGYNRPWYEYVQKYDTAHGLYRTSLRNFIMNRTFDEKPELSESFLLVDPYQVNDVFAVTDVSDKIFGQIYFNVTAKMPIGRQAIPRLD